MEGDEISSLPLLSTLKSTKKIRKAIVSLFKHICKKSGDQEALSCIPVRTRAAPLTTPKFSTLTVRRHFLKFKPKSDGFIQPSLALLSVKPPDCEFGVFLGPTDDAVSAEVAERGIFDDLIRYLVEISNAETPDDLVCNAAATVMSLTVRSSTNQARIRGLGGITALAQLLKTSSNDNALFWICACLRNIARHDENMPTLSEMNIVPRLVELIQSTNLILQEAAAGALWNIAWGGSIGSQSDTESMKHVINLMKSTNDNIVNCGSSILMNLTMGESEENREIVIAAGGVEALVMALDKTNPKVQYSVAGAISNLAVDDKLICRVFGDLGALGKLMNLVRTDHPNVVDAAAGAIWNLLQLPANRKLLPEEDISHFLSLVSKWKTNSALENILGVIDQFATEEHRFTLFSLGALPLIMDIFLESDNSVTLLQAMHILYELSWHPDGFDPIYHNKAFIKKLGDLVNAGQEPDVRSSAMSTLYPAAGMIDLIEPVLDIIIEQLGSTESVISSIAFELLGRLCVTTPARAFTPRSIHLAIKALQGDQNHTAAADAMSFLELLANSACQVLLCEHIVTLIDIGCTSDSKQVRQFCRGSLLKLSQGVPEQFTKITGLVRRLSDLQQNPRSSRASKMSKKLLESLQTAFTRLPGKVVVPPTSTECSMDFLVGNTLYSDMKLIIQGEKVPVHRCVLHGRSAYFRALFESGMKEAEQRELELKTDFSKDEWMELIRFIYTDSCRITTQNVQSLIEMADLYSLSRLSALCEEFLANTVTEEEVFHFLRLALDARMPQLKAICLQFIVTKLDLSQHILSEEEQEILEAAGV